MQVFGLPRHVIRNAGAASRLLASEDARYRSGEKTRCRRSMAPCHGRRPRRRAGGPRRRRAAGHALSLGKAPVPKSRRPPRTA